MNIEKGNLYVNKTWRFLLPCVRGHGNEFVDKFNLVYKLAVGIHDTLLDASALAQGRNIYILCDTSINNYRFEQFLKFVREQSYYVLDYCPDSEIIFSTKMMIVINVPEIFYNSYDNFLQSKYSKMYKKKDYDILFKDKKLEHDVITNNYSLIQNFRKKINQEFDTTITDDDLFFSKDYLELELPLKKEEEIFNYKKNNTVFFNDRIDKKWQL